MWLNSVCQESQSFSVIDNARVTEIFKKIYMLYIDEALRMYVMIPEHVCLQIVSSQYEQRMY
jgi:hypothetical protein